MSLQPLFKLVTLGGCYILRWYRVTHPSTNWVRCRITSLIKIDALPPTSYMWLFVAD